MIRRVIDAVRANPGQTREQIAIALGISSTSTRTALTALRSEKWKLVEASGGRGKDTTYWPSVS
jgi:hypothetical protein